MLSLTDNNGKYIESLKSWIYEGEIRSQESVLIETSYVVLGNVQSTELVANYNLIILGNLIVDRVHVKKDLFVLGNIQTNELLVSGNANCIGDIESNLVKIGGSLSTKGFQIVDATIGWNLTIKNSFVEGSLIVENEIICQEGIAGSGSCSAKNILIKEYKHINTNSDQEIILSDAFNVEKPLNHGIKSEISKLMDQELFQHEKLMGSYNELLLKLNNFVIDTFENYVNGIEERFDYDEISESFQLIQKKLPLLGNYIESYLQIMRFGEMSSITYVEDFITLMILKHNTPKFLYNISIVSDVLISFYNSQKENLERLELQNVDQNSIIHNLYFLSKSRHLLSQEEYQLLFEKLSHCLNVDQIDTTFKGTPQENELKNILYNIVPEIKEGKVEIKSISREKGIRSKVAVHSIDNLIDSVGSCVGYKGERVRTLIQSLGGEKVDIILWSPVPEIYIKNSLSPAEILKVDIVGKEAKVEVSNVDQYTAAIGKKGINTILASGLTGYRIVISMK